MSNYTSTKMILSRKNSLEVHNKQALVEIKLWAHGYDPSVESVSNRGFPKVTTSTNCLLIMTVGLRQPQM